MLSRLRLRLSQAFATVLSMSQRMQFELQRSGSASETQPLLELFASYPPEAQRVALDAILRVHEALTGEAATLTTGLPDLSGEAAAAEPSADATSTVPPRGVDPSKRLLALEQLADTLSEEESQVLIRSVARRRAALSASAEL